MSKSLPIKDICLDGKTQQRPVDDKVVAHYAGMMKDGSKYPAVEIITDGESYFLWDGFHRLAAARKLGKKYIEANVVNGTKRDAIFTSFSANKKNAFPRQPGTAKGIVEKILRDREWSKMAQTDIARHVGCTHQFVSKIQAEFEKLSCNQLHDRTALSGQKAGLSGQKTGRSASETINVKRGDSEYEMKKPKKKVLDATGKEVPKHLVKFFKRANEFRQPVKQLNDMLKAVREGKEAGDQLFKFVKIENLTAEIGNVKRIFRFGMPYAVCRYCGGDEMNAECRACDGCGFVNEQTYKATPEELK